MLCLTSSSGDTVALRLSIDGILEERSNDGVRTKEFEHYYMGVEAHESRVATLIGNGFQIIPQGTDSSCKNSSRDSDQVARAMAEIQSRARELEAAPLSHVGHARTKLDEVLRRWFWTLSPDAPDFCSWFHLTWSAGGGCGATADFDPSTDPALERLQDNLDLDLDDRLFEAAWTFAARALLVHPCAASLEVLDLRSAHPSSLQAFSQVAAPSALRSLAVPRSTRDLCHVSRAANSVSELVVQYSALSSMLSVPWPNLNRLAIHYTRGSCYLSLTSLADIAPCLKVLSLSGYWDIDAVARDLSRLKARLELATLELVPQGAPPEHIFGSLEHNQSVFRNIPHLLLPRDVGTHGIWRGFPPMSLLRWENIVWF